MYDTYTMATKTLTPDINTRDVYDTYTMVSVSYTIHT